MVVTLAYSFLKNGDALIFKGLAELDHLSTFRINGQWGHDHISSFPHELTHETGPFLFARDVVPLQGSILILSQMKAKGEIRVTGQ